MYIGVGTVGGDTAVVSEKANIVLVNLNQVALCTAGYAATCKYAVHQANANVIAACRCICYLHRRDQNGTHWTTPGCVQCVAMTRCFEGSVTVPLSTGAAQQWHISCNILVLILNIYLQLFVIELMVLKVWCKAYGATEKAYTETTKIDCSTATCSTGRLNTQQAVVGQGHSQYQLNNISRLVNVCT